MDEAEEELQVAPGAVSGEVEKVATPVESDSQQVKQYCLTVLQQKN